MILPLMKYALLFKLFYQNNENPSKVLSEYKERAADITASKMTTGKLSAFILFIVK